MTRRQGDMCSRSHRESVRRDSVEAHVLYTLKSLKSPIRVLSETMLKSLKSPIRVLSETMRHVLNESCARGVILRVYGEYY
jgi:hypothetical protein